MGNQSLYYLNVVHITTNYCGVEGSWLLSRWSILLSNTVTLFCDHYFIEWRKMISVKDDFVPISKIINHEMHKRNKEIKDKGRIVVYWYN